MRNDTNKINMVVQVMVLNATFNNISVISWQSVLLMEETEVPGENNRPTLSHNVVSITPHNFSGDRHCLHR